MDEIIIEDDKELQSVDILSEAIGSLSEEDIREIMSEVDNVSWVENNRVLKGEPFSFVGRDYLLDIYRDDFKNIIVYKGRQVEMSEFTMNWMLRKLWRYPYTAGLHTFPRVNQCSKFSKQRLDHAIKDSKSIKEWYVSKESEQLMRKFIKHKRDKNNPGEMIDEYGFYVFGGTWESRKDTVGDAARGLTVDFIAYDERQDHPDDVETVIGESASHSEYKQTITLGTPKLPGTQFDKQWESSNKNYWNVTCTKCGNVAPIDLDNILEVDGCPEDEMDYYYGCSKCGVELDRLNGEWIPQNPQKRPLYHGYHINQLMVTWITPNEIMEKFLNETYSKRRFYNEVLGVAYGGDDVPITLEKLYKCAENTESLQEFKSNARLSVGIDWGNTSWCFIEEKTKYGHRTVDILIADDKDPRKHPKVFARKLRKYRQNIMKVVCDAGPDITRFYNLRDELKGVGISKRKVFACYYLSPPAKVKIKWNNDEFIVSAGRSEFIDMLIDEIDDQEFIIPGNDVEKDNIGIMMDHFCNLSAERKKSNNGMEFVVYSENGDDHLLHSKIYADIASYGASDIVVGSTAGGFETSRDNNVKSPIGKRKHKDGNSKYSKMSLKRSRRRM